THDGDLSDPGPVLSPTGIAPRDLCAMLCAQSVAARLECRANVVAAAKARSLISTPKRRCPSALQKEPALSPFHKAARRDSRYRFVDLLPNRAPVPATCSWRSP